jgi:hypothetical protein
MSAGYLASMGQKFSGALPGQRLKLDKALSNFNLLLTDQNF